MPPSGIWIKLIPWISQLSLTKSSVWNNAISDNSDINSSHGQCVSTGVRVSSIVLLWRLTSTHPHTSTAPSPQYLHTPRVPLRRLEAFIGLNTEGIKVTWRTSAVNGVCQILSSAWCNLLARPNTHISHVLYRNWSFWRRPAAWGLLLIIWSTCRRGTGFQDSSFSSVCWILSKILWPLSKR